MTCSYLIWGKKNPLVLFVDSVMFKRKQLHQDAANTSKQPHNCFILIQIFPSPERRTSNRRENQRHNNTNTNLSIKQPELFWCDLSIHTLHISTSQLWIYVLRAFYRAAVDVPPVGDGSFHPELFIKKHPSH